MRKVIITIEDYLYEFYKKVGENAGGLMPERSWQMRCSSWQENCRLMQSMKKTRKKRRLKVRKPVFSIDGSLPVLQPIAFEAWTLANRPKKPKAVFSCRNYREYGFLFLYMI